MSWISVLVRRGRETRVHPLSPCTHRERSCRCPVRWWPSASQGKGVTKERICWHPDLWFPTSRWREINVCCLSDPVCSPSYSSLSRLRHWSPQNVGHSVNLNLKHPCSQPVVVTSKKKPFFLHPHSSQSMGRVKSASFFLLFFFFSSFASEYFWKKIFLSLFGVKV